MSDVTDRAKVALEGVTEGPWVASKDRQDRVDRSDGWIYPGNIVSDVTRQIVFTQTGNAANSGFIAAARQLVPDLVAENERLEAEVARLTPRRIDTVGELDALPIGSVVRTTEGRVAIKSGECHGSIMGYQSYWQAPGEYTARGSNELDDLPAVVLWSSQCERRTMTSDGYPVGMTIDQINYEAP